MSDNTFTVSVDGGKYSATFDNGKLTVLRNGEPWQDFSGNKFVYLLLAEIVNQRKIIEEVGQLASGLPDDGVGAARRIMEITAPGFHYDD